MECFKCYHTERIQPTMKNVFKTSFIYFPAFLAAITGLLQWAVLQDLPESPVYLMACAIPFALLVALLQVFPWVLIANIFQKKTRIVRNRLVLLPLFIVNAIFPTLTLDIVLKYLAPLLRRLRPLRLRPGMDPHGDDI